ncbi:hypothetical protein [Streptomyces sp. NPDC060027]
MTTNTSIMTPTEETAHEGGPQHNEIVVEAHEGGPQHNEIVVEI